MLVTCSYHGCNQRRAHHESPHIMRKHRMVDVPAGFDPIVHRAYCSIECKAYNGHQIMRDGIDRFNERMRYVDPRNVL